MELGNMTFGNSRGNYPVSRSDGWHDELVRLLNVVDKDRDSSWREYGVNFENDVFFMMPYYSGDCVCGYEDKEWKWEKKNNHREGCYQHSYPQQDYSISHSEWLEKHIKPLYKSYGFETESEDWWHGCAMRCSCDFNERWEMFLSKNEHKSSCKIIKPNFLYKPTAFEIQWYKYPFRDSYMNINLSVSDFSEIVDKCIASVRCEKGE